ncbi:MAG TPA: response regulator transcription factor [Chloroflexi bacterium]|nr:response regulator transcription factor [Chloroflexota bacterium]
MSSKGYVLIVDDQLAIRLFASAALTRAGYTTYMAVSGAEALQRMGQEPNIDVVLLDLRMPDMDGLETMAEIIKYPTRPEVIFLTAYPDFNAAVETIRMKGQDYLLKPCTADQLLHSVEKAMAQRREKLCQEQMMNLIEETVEKLSHISSLQKQEEMTKMPAAQRPPKEPPASAPCQQLLELRGLSLDLENRRVTRLGEPLHLTTSEFDILRALMVNADKATSYHELAEVLHGQVIRPRKVRRALNTHLWRLRHKLQSGPDGQPYIKNIHRYGYQFVATPSSEEKGWCSV